VEVVVSNNDCPAQFRYEYGEEVCKALAKFTDSTNDSSLDDTLIIECPFKGCDRAFELFYMDFCGTRDVRNRVLGTVCLKEV